MNADTHWVGTWAASPAPSEAGIGFNNHTLRMNPRVSIGGSTQSSPTRTLSRFELSRYLDYCSEMLSLTSKVAVLYAQSFPDTEVTDAVSDVERIAAGLSQKVWQKIMILQSAGIDTARAAVPAPASAAPAVARQPAAVAVVRLLRA